MKRRRFGRTELAMPVFTCGGMRYQYQWQDRPLSEIPPENQRNLENTIRRALELGINHIETARGYGTSERQLGLILPALRRELIIQTKVAPTEDARQFVEDVRDSLARLQLPSVDLLSIHGVNDKQTRDWTLRAGGCFEAAQALRREGLCRFVGFSSHASLELILELIGHGAAEIGAGFDYVNLHWYYIFQRNYPAIVAATERDMGVFIISPNDKGGRLFDPPEKLVSLCEPFSPMRFNDLFCLSESRVHTLSIGASRPSDFDEHVACLPELEPGPAALTRRLAPTIKRLEDAMEAVMGVRSPEALTPGLPEMEHTPGGHNLELLLWLLHLARGWGMTEYAKTRMNMMGNAGHWFPGAKAATLPAIDEGRLAEVLASHPQRTRIPALLRAAHAELAGAEVKRLSQSSA